MVPMGRPTWAFQRGEDIAPERRFLGGLDFRQIQDERRTGLPQRLMVVHHVQRGVNDGSGEATAVGMTHVPVVEV